MANITFYEIKDTDKTGIIIAHNGREYANFDDTDSDIETYENQSFEVPDDKVLELTHLLKCDYVTFISK